MANEEVAPGDGAFLQFKILPSLLEFLSLCSKIKSSTKDPSAARAWARTPAGPLQILKKF